MDMRAGVLGSLTTDPTSCPPKIDVVHCLKRHQIKHLCNGTTARVIFSDDAGYRFPSALVTSAQF
jgi:hypothetical protein